MAHAEQRLWAAIVENPQTGEIYAMASSTASFGRLPHTLRC
jgi:cell division protein FtsI/penicillin-binding protein 2